MKLELAAIRIDGGTQAREALDQSVVTRYAEKMQEGDVFPPLVVFFDGSDHWLADGFHRYFAIKSNGGLESECEVKEGTVRDAELYSYSANGNKRGLGWNTADIRKILNRMLQDDEWKQWSDTKIAKHVDVSKMTVGRTRRALEEQGKVEPKKTVKYVDKHGNTGEMNTGKIKKKATKSADQSADENTAKGSDFDDKITELTDTITQLHDENTLLKDKIAIGQWDASEIEKIDAEEVIADLRKQVKILEMENKSLRDSRDMFQNRNSELMQTLKVYKNKLKKAGLE